MATEWPARASMVAAIGAGKARANDHNVERPVHPHGVPWHDSCRWTWPALYEGYFH